MVVKTFIWFPQAVLVASHKTEELFSKTHLIKQGSCLIQRASKKVRGKRVDTELKQKSTRLTIDSLRPLDNDESI